MIDYFQKNELAILELENGNELLAQTMLRTNAKKFPHSITLNNLGVYYSQYGMKLRNGKLISASKNGLKYLLKATLHEKDWRIFVSAATAAWECHNLQLARQLLIEAFRHTKNETILYNMGACAYRLGNHHEAMVSLSSLCNSNITEQIINQGGLSPSILLAYCYYELKDIQKCIECIRSYQNTWNANERFDVFCLKYFCGLYYEALSETDLLLNEWYPTPTILAMIADCLFFVPEFSGKVPVPDDKEKYFQRLKKDLVLRKRIISKYSFVPPMISMYQFIRAEGHQRLLNDSECTNS